MAYQVWGLTFIALYPGYWPRACHVTPWYLEVTEVHAQYCFFEFLITLSMLLCKVLHHGLLFTTAAAHQEAAAVCQNLHHGQFELKVNVIVLLLLGCLFAKSAAHSELLLYQKLAPRTVSNSNSLTGFAAAALTLLWSDTPGVQQVQPIGSCC